MRLAHHRSADGGAATPPPHPGYLGVLAIRRLPLRAALTLAALVLLLALAAVPAEASRSQLAMIEEDAGLHANPQPTMDHLRALGAGIVRVYVEWSSVAPDPRSFHKPHFNAEDPASYGNAWAPYDAIVRAAENDNMQVDFLVTGGAPFWATGPGIPHVGKNVHFAWRPSAGDYGAFVRAIGDRYSGHYGSLPAVHYWEIWNEPNFGEDLAPQAIDGSTVSVAPEMYRGLLNAGWSALGATGHGHDTIVIGGLAARGMQLKVDRSHPQGLPGNFAQTKPLQFIRTLYCVGSSFRPLRGRAARGTGCPTSSAGSRRFVAANPALFKAGGFGIHPYPQNLPPTEEASGDPDYVAFSEIPRLEGQLDRVQRVYHSHRRFTIYNNEYGYVTDPPARPTPTYRFVSPRTAGYYINWAEYLSWRSSRIATTMQYLLYDPLPHGPSQFFSGLESSRGVPKASYYAYRMPLYMPVTSVRHAHRLEVWGDVRPAHIYPGLQHAQIQFQRGSRGSFQTISTPALTSARGYFDVGLTFRASGSVRVAFTAPDGATITSRVQKVTVR